MFTPLFTKELNRDISPALRSSIKQSFDLACEYVISGYKYNGKKRRK